MKIEIKSITGAILSPILFSGEYNSIKLGVEDAVKQRADLRGADLRGADLRGADLRDADLRGAYLRDAELGGADLRGADLRGADLRVADLRDAELRDADLRGADLRDADLRDAYLRGAKYRDIEIINTPIQILGLRWDIFIIGTYLKIGCEEHLITKWREFDDDRIAQMEPNALDFWHANKAKILAFCEEDS